MLRGLAPLGLANDKDYHHDDQDYEQPPEQQHEQCTDHAAAHHAAAHHMSHTAHHAVAHPSAAGEATHEQQDQQNPAQGTQKDLQTIAHRTNLQTIDVIEPLAKRFLSPAYVEILHPRSGIDVGRTSENFVMAKFVEQEFYEVR